MIIISGSLSIHFEKDTAYAANGTITFKGTEADIFGPDGIATDGEGGSTDIAGITIQVFGIDSTWTKLSEGKMQYFDGENPNWLGYPSLITWFDDKNTPTHGLAIKSEDGSNFKLSSVNFHDWGYWDGKKFAIEAFDNGLSKGIVTFTGNTDGSYIPLNHSTMLTSIFDNVDEVRIYGNEDANSSYVSINDIEIADAFLPDTTAPILSNLTVNNITQNSATVSASSNEDATLYYIVSENVNLPTGNQVLEGKDANNLATNWSGFRTQSAGELGLNFFINGLSKGILYYVYLVAQDSTSNLSTVERLTFTTLKDSYTITFKDWDNSSLKSETVTHGGNATAPVNPMRTGYTFTGWDIAFTNVTENLIVTAQFKVNEYTVSFNSNEGSTVTAINADYGTCIVAPPEPTKTGYTFDGWYKEAGLNNAWNFGVDTVPVNGITLYAKWTVNNPLVTINHIDAIGDISVSVGTTLAAIVFPTSVNLTLSDNAKLNVSVSWDNGNPPYNGNAPGNYEFTGTLTLPVGVTNPTGHKAKVKVIVKPATETEKPKWPAGSDLSFTGISTTSIRLSWPTATDNTAVTSYRIYVNGVEKAIVGDHEHSYIVTGLNAQTTYNFAVQAYDAAGNSSLDLGRSATTLSPPVTPDGSGSGSSDNSGSEPSYVPSGNTDLQELKVLLNGQMLTLTPDGSAFILNTEASEVELFPTTAHSAAKVTLNGNSLVEGQKTPLHEGINVFELTIEAENGTKKTYTVTIQRTPTEQVAPPIVPVEPDPVEPVNPVPPIKFDDTTGHWAEEYIQQATTLGILKGYPDGTFKPNNPLTRAQAASIIVRALHLQTDEAAPFKDIGNYADETQAEIAAAYQFGIIKGSNGNFKPSDKITRAQIALMIQRAYEYKTGTKYDTDKAPYSDFGNYDAETINAISMLHELGIATGSEGKFNPGTQTTRAQAAKMFVNLLVSLK